MARRLIAIAALTVLFGAISQAQPATPGLRPATRPVAAITASGSWTTYHHDNAHSGYDPAAPPLGPIAVTSGWAETPLDGEIYAEPLVYKGIVYTATLNNTVYALNQSDGAEIWHRTLGMPQTSGWVCGNVAPMGILGTPVIDAAGSRIYVAALSSDHVYRVYGLDLATGGIGLATVIPASIGTGFDWKIQQQRGALALANGHVYVPFGGRAGDCFDAGTAYHGWVVGLPIDGTSPLLVFETPAAAESVWSPGGVVVDDASHNVFVPTGNAIPCSNAMLSDAVVRLSPTLTGPTFFQPNDWQANWCGPDSDLGSASPLLISSSLMFMAGKRGGGFLLDPTNLGGVDGQLFPTPKPANYSQAEVCLGNHSAATYGSFAYAAPYLYLECEGRGLVALQVSPAAKSFVPCPSGCAAPNWNALNGTTFGPPIVAAGAVWAATDGGGLYAFNAITGTQVFHSANFGINRFVTPAEAGGQVFVPSHSVIKSFSFAGSIGLTPGRLDFNGQVPGTTSNAQTITLHNNGTTAVHVTAATPSGANPGQYLKGTDNCSGATLASGGTCTVQVSFHPTAFGGYPASLDFTDDGPGSPQLVPVGGLGALDNQAHIYTLDGYGGIHPVGTAPPLNSSAYWPGWNIARGVAVLPDGLGGYVLDGYGGLHPVGNANQTPSSAYWSGWDIARQIVLAPWATKASPAGWTLDGWGGLHPFGGAPAVSGATYWQGWDIARSVVILPDSTPASVAGYTLDGYGGIHPFGGAQAAIGSPYWGWDIARGLTVSPNASKTNAAGWVLDGNGGVYPFGTAPTFGNVSYWGWDIARGLVPWTGSGAGGWTVDGYGGIHPFGAAPAVQPFTYWPGWDIATGMTGTNFSSASRGRP